MASKNRFVKLNFSWPSNITKRSSFVGATVIADYTDGGYRNLVLERHQSTPKIDLGKEYNDMKAADEAYEDELKEKS